MGKLKRLTSSRSSQVELQENCKRVSNLVYELCEAVVNVNEDKEAHHLMAESAQKSPD
jgi:hypothetical protein